MTVIQSSKFVKNPFVSVVIPSYNRVDVVGQTIDSILNQQCNFEFELIIGDDCSTDNVREVLQVYQAKYPTKIKLLFYDTNLGLGANWATCVQHCRGKYVANCDNDDFWHNPEKLQLQVDYMEQHTDIGVCHTYHRNYYQKKDKYIEYLSNNNDQIREPLYLAILNINGFECCNSSILYRKDVLDKHINLDDYLKNKFTLQDWNTWVVLAQYTRFYCLPVLTTTIRIDNNSITRNKDVESLYKRLVKEEGTYNYVVSKLENYKVDESGYKSYMFNVLLNASFSKFNYSKAVEYAKKLKELNSENKRIKFTESMLFFYCYCISKRLKLHIKRIVE
jgi:glycosyltransferase involved in cell wall biosynthesis